MSEEIQVIGYGTRFTTSFLGMETVLRVVSPVDQPAPEVNVAITYVNAASIKATVELEGDFFENLLAVLTSIRQHTSLLVGAESSFLKDAEAILFSDMPPARITATRAKKMMGGTKDEVKIVIEELVISRSLDDKFFREVEQLQTQISQAKQTVGGRIASYLSRR